MKIHPLIIKVSEETGEARSRLIGAEQLLRSVFKVYFFFRNAIFDRKICKGPVILFIERNVTKRYGNRMGFIFQMLLGVR